MATASKAMFDSLNTNDNVVFLFGGYCNTVTKPIAETMNSFNLWQVYPKHQACSQCVKKAIIVSHNAILPLILKRGENSHTTYRNNTW